MDVAVGDPLADAQHGVLAGTEHPIGLVSPDRVQMDIDGMNRLRHETADLHLGLLAINSHT